MLSTITHLGGRGRLVRALGILLLTLAAAVPPAFGELGRVGPTSTAYGYPAWYQDKTGLTVEFCTPLNSVELSEGWCLLLPADTTAPEVFPSAFSEEHFYWAAGALATFPIAANRTGRASLTLALEGAFGSGTVVAGEQVVFGRIRVNIDTLPQSGTYTVQHPYGTLTIPNQVAGGRLFVTEDIGISCPPGQFDCALAARIGPFLLPSATVGGAELPPVAGPVPGKLYIANPARLGPVTGSPVGQNFFRVVAPSGAILVETSNFSLVGRAFTGTIPGQVSVDRATYTRNAGETVGKLDVFATAFETTQARTPGSPPPPGIAPVLGFYPAPCLVDQVTGALAEPPGVGPAVQMFDAGSSGPFFWGQSQPAGSPAVIPPAVCVEDYTSRDVTGQVVPTFFQATVTDEVTITQALYDPATSTLSVSAASSDSSTINPVTLNLPGFGPLVSGQISVSPISAPPARVRVASTAGGLGEATVKTGVGTPGGSGIPVALPDEVAVLEDSGPTPINVLVNDTLNGTPIGAGTACPAAAPATPCVAIVVAPRLGTAAVNGGGTISFTPFLNANGLEGIGYQVRVNGVSSSTAYVTINITAVNDPPVAVNDTAGITVNTPVAISVLANDTDVDGQAELANAVNVTLLTSPPLAVWSAVAAGGTVTFTANLAGTYTFTYRAQDTGLLSSANTATVTVTVGATETIAVARAEFIVSKARWRVAGTDSVRANQTLTIAYANGTLLDNAPLAGTVIGTVVVDTAGAWLLDQTGPGILNPAANNLFGVRPTRIKVTSPLGGVIEAPFALK